MKISKDEWKMGQSYYSACHAARRIKESLSFLAKRPGNTNHVEILLEQKDWLNMIPRVQNMKRAAFPLFRYACQKSTTPPLVAAARVPFPLEYIQNQSTRFCQSRCLSSSSIEDSSVSETAVITDWNELYPSPSAIDVTPLAESLRAQVRDFTKHKKPLRLVGILANEGSHRLDSEIYSERIQLTFEEDGIDYEVWKYPEMDQDCDTPLATDDESPQSRLEWIKEKIKTINDSSDIDGALVFYPIHPFGPKGPYKCKLTGVYYKTQDDHIRDLIHPDKDVEGLCGTKWFQIRDSRQKNPPSIYPCTALSVLRILEEYHIGGATSSTQNSEPNICLKGHANNASLTDSGSIHNKIDQNKCWKDQTISIVNRSEIMGRPLAVMLAEKGATVYSIDIDSILQFRPDGKRLRRCNPSTTTLETCLKESTVVVAGVPCPDFCLPLSSIPQGSTIVSVSEFPNVCEQTLFQKRPDIKYIPQVGKVTVATLSLNLMHLKQKRWKENT